MTADPNHESYVVSHLLADPGYSDWVAQAPESDRWGITLSIVRYAASDVARQQPDANENAIYSTLFGYDWPRWSSIIRDKHEVEQKAQEPQQAAPQPWEPQQVLPAQNPQPWEPGPAVPSAVPAFPVPEYQPTQSGGSVASPRGRYSPTLLTLSIVLSVIISGVISAAMGTYFAAHHTVVEKYSANSGAPARPQDAQSILADVEPSVVSILAQLPNNHISAGTGIIVSSSGEVLTNNHVIEGASEVEVFLYGQNGSPVLASVVGALPQQDLALLQISGSNDLVPAPIGNSSSMKVGDYVLAVGNALGLQGGLTVTSGIVSALGRSVSVRTDTGIQENLTNLIQTDAPINPGNSGGPIVNSGGQVVGINVAAAVNTLSQQQAQGIGFAIPINSAMRYLPSLRAGK